jgi:hypothetical protein
VCKPGFFFVKKIKILPFWEGEKKRSLVKNYSSLLNPLPEFIPVKHQEVSPFPAALCGVKARGIFHRKTPVFFRSISFKFNINEDSVYMLEHF